MSRLISTAAQCRSLDAEAIERIPGVALMELASKGVFEVIVAQLAAEARKGVLVLCGGGNNGGDGYGVARWLHLRGFPVATWSNGSASHGDAAILREAAKRAGVEQITAPRPCGLVVDALFGTGLTRPVEGVSAQMLQAVAELGVPVLAVDLPSGLHADTGEHLGSVLTATHTVTFGRLKPALFTPGGRAAGRIHLVDIGVSATGSSIAQLTAASDLSWPARASGAHKHALGSLAVVAGSPEMAGAAVLTCLGAVRGGAGLVTLFTHPDAFSRLSGLPASVMVRSWDPTESELTGYDAVAIGPGLGGGKPLSSANRVAIEGLLVGERSLVADADALFATESVAPHVVRTPHPGEAGRLLGIAAKQVQSDRFRWVQELPGVTLLKGQHTLVHARGAVTVNPTNSPVLATAGSGDVLTGLIGALLARGVESATAARTAAWVHGRAGERLEAIRVEGWCADDLVAAVPEAIEELQHASR